MKRDCAIVRDLLPSYLENITSEETNEFVQTHLQNCSECNQLVEEFSSNIEPIIPPINQERQNEHERNLVKRIQKRNGRTIILSLLVGVLLCMFTLISFRVNSYFLIIWVYPLVTIFLGFISALLLNEVFVAPLIILIILSIGTVFININGIWFWIVVYFIFSLGGSLLGIGVKSWMAKSKGRLR
jgi:hypothetical protein